MRRIEPSYPDLLPVHYRLGTVPPPAAGARLDPVTMRLVWPEHGQDQRLHDGSGVRRPVQLLVHARTVATQRETLAALLAAGCGVLLLLDEELSPSDVPERCVAGQVVVAAPWLPELWHGRPIQPLGPWNEAGMPAGVFLGLAPVEDPAAAVARGVTAAREAGATFLVAIPVCVPPLDRRRLLEDRFGTEGDEGLEDLFFHCDLGELTLAMERGASRLAHVAGLAEHLPGPATSLLAGETFAAAAALLLWARRLDILDGVASVGWQLRRAAQALMASRQDVAALLREDNLRVIPGFEPWVEAFARSLWAGEGQPFDEVRRRWLVG